MFNFHIKFKKIKKYFENQNRSCLKYITKQNKFEIKMLLLDAKSNMNKHPPPNVHSPSTSKPALKMKDTPPEIAEIKEAIK